MSARSGVLVAAVVLFVSSITFDASALSTCGTQAQPCCPSDTCDPGLYCETNCAGEILNGGGGRGAAANCPGCYPCGGTGQPCCPGDSCNQGLNCIADVCQDCGLPGEGCCSGEQACAEGFVCHEVPCFDTAGDGGGAGPGVPCEILSSGTGGGAEVNLDCFPCGGEAQLCCDRDVCDAGFECLPRPPCEETTSGTGGGAGECEQLDGAGGGGGRNGEICLPCGDLGESCCGESMCNADNLLCGAEFCEACGDIGLQCCGNDTCPVEGLCVDGTCRPGAAPVASGSGMAFLILLLSGIGFLGMRRLRA